MPGPQPQPAALKVLRGNPGHRPIPREPKVDRTFPPPPKDLEPEAATHWRGIGRAYAKAGVVSTLDADVLRIYVEQFVKYRRAALLLAKQDLIIYTDKGRERNPLDIICRDSAQTLRMYARELGLTPASRVGLGRTEEEPGDALDSWKAAKKAAK